LVDELPFVSVPDDIDLRVVRDELDRVLEQVEAEITRRRTEEDAKQAAEDKARSAFLEELAVKG
jgi:hypothetical protein